MSVVTDSDQAQFIQKGYMVLERVIPVDAVPFLKDGKVVYDHSQDIGQH